MNDPSRAAVKLAAFLLPAVLLAGALHLWGSDFRGLVVRMLEGGPRTVERATFTLRAPNRAWANDLTEWTEKGIADLVERGRLLGFRTPDKSLLIVVLDAPIPPAFNPRENSITLPKKLESKEAYLRLSNLLTRALLDRAGPPDAAWSPWLKEGLATYFQTSEKIVGSRKDDLMRQAADRLESLSLQGLLQGSEAQSSGFSAASHSLVAYLFVDHQEGKLREYFDEERKPGPVATGTFERIFGPDIERDWKESLKPYQKH
ncbi:MAG TPA: hypothetical protein VGK61_01075 [Planctomycetota bacterium]|jgi:hypothetical protein